MLRAILNKSWRNTPTRHQLYGHLPPITKTIQVRRTRHAGHCWRSRNELISDVLLWTPTYGRAKAGRPARTYIQQLCEDTGCSPEDLPKAINDREKWRERVRDIRVSGTTWWWWWWYAKIFLNPFIDYSLLNLVVKWVFETTPFHFFLLLISIYLSIYLSITSVYLYFFSFHSPSSFFSFFFLSIYSNRLKQTIRVWSIGLDFSICAPHICLFVSYICFLLLTDM